MFKVKHKKSGEIYIVLDTYLDEIYANTYFLIWDNNGWRWRSADNFVPPNVDTAAGTSK